MSDLVKTHKEKQELIRLSKRLIVKDSKLVKTGMKIHKEVMSMDTKKWDENYLILPDGLDKLEEMLKDYRREHGKLSYDEITLMFDVFKKENSL